MVLFDSHAHLVAHDQGRYPRNPLSRNPLGPPRLPGTVGRPGGHHGPEPIHAVPDPEDMLKWMAEENVVMGVAVQKRMIYRYDNSLILDACDQHPDLLLPLVILDAEDEATPGLLATWRAAHGLTGVRLFGYRQEDATTPWLNSPRARRTWKAAEELGLVVDLEVICREGGHVAIPSALELAQAYPRIPIVLDHMLEPHVTDADFGLGAGYAQLAAVKSIFFKFTSINLDILRESGVDAAKFLRRAVDFYGADRIMWGSDIGTSSGTYKDMVQRALDACAHLSTAERDAVLHSTGRRVFVRGGQVDNPQRR
jgi:predicted TIM-barrel fold metal-dependent hydrolase